MSLYTAFEMFEIHGAGVFYSYCIGKSVEQLSTFYYMILVACCIIAGEYFTALGRLQMAVKCYPCRIQLSEIYLKGSLNL